MGVPAYFRWISEKYPNIMATCIEQTSYDASDGTFLPVDASAPNPNGVEFDNLYLDMNGIIHPCTHPEDGPAPTTEFGMFEAVCKYIDRIFAIVRPRKLIYLAIDGVAPRAKINQQRSRRFRSAQEAKEKQQMAKQLRDDWRKLGLRVTSDSTREGSQSPSDEKLSAEDNDVNLDPTSFVDTPFDSNVITPGTPFMSRLAVALRNYINERILTSPSWRDLVVIFSDASVPGEGEHKIAEFIRRERAHSGYDPNLRHVMYGLDADLIMLALATHEVNFTILREEVFPKRGGQHASNGTPSSQPSSHQPNSNAQSDAIPQTDAGTDQAVQLLSALGGRKPFHFLHVHVLREYLDYEFSHDIEAEIAMVKGDCELAYDLERVLDDFVFLCFFVGNDFLPHLPTLDIREGAIEFLIELYKTEFVHTGYLTSPGGDIDFAAVRKLLVKTGEREDEIFQQRTFRERVHAERTARDKREKRAADEMNQSDVLDSSLNPSDSKKRPALGQGSDEPVLEQTVKLGGKASGQVGTPQGRASVNATLASAFRRTRGTDIKEKHSKGDDTQSKSNVAPEKTDVTLPVVKKSESEFKEVLKQRIRDKNEIVPTDTVKLGEPGWKKRYYLQKFGWDENHDAEKKMLLRKYVEGLHWVMKYYYFGCISWGWYYPYHYSPFASDLVECDLTTKDIVMELGTPFEPFTQLQAVMPASSGRLVLPKCYADLMSDSRSPIIDYYPEDFPTDLNGKRYAWQGVALLPFIDENRLRNAIDPLQHLLTDEERQRNSFGHCYVMVHRDSLLGQESQSRSANDAGELKKIPRKAANGFLFGHRTYPLKEYGGHTAPVLTLRFELPSQAPHASHILPSATRLSSIVSEFDKAKSRGQGWRASRHGPLGRAAQDLIVSRQQRMSGRGRWRARGRGRGRDWGHGRGEGSGFGNQGRTGTGYKRHSWPGQRNGNASAYGGTEASGIDNRFNILQQAPCAAYAGGAAQGGRGRGRSWTSDPRNQNYNNDARNAHWGTHAYDYGESRGGRRVWNGHSHPWTGHYHGATGNATANYYGAGGNNYYNQASSYYDQGSSTYNTNIRRSSRQYRYNNYRQSYQYDGEGGNYQYGAGVARGRDGQGQGRAGGLAGPTAANLRQTRGGRGNTHRQSRYPNNAPG